jgi:hypothetical protein
MWSYHATPSDVNNLVTLLAAFIGAPESKQWEEVYNMT